jgi:hypothetical protein
VLKVIETEPKVNSGHIVDAENHDTILFVVRKQLVDVYKQHPNTLLLDCTYKTNQYNIPLLNVCGVTSENKNIALGCAFLENEQSEGPMKWSLNCLREMFDG